MIRIRRRGLAASIIWLLSRPSSVRYRFHDWDRREVESGTLRLGFVQIKWTRYLDGAE